MPYSRREKIGRWLERNVPWVVLRLFLTYDGHGLNGRHYVNRVSGHLVVR